MALDKAKIDSNLGKKIHEHLCVLGIETPTTQLLFSENNEKVEKIQGLTKQIWETLGLDLTDDSLQGTPHRVAKMFVQEIFSGLNPANKPKISVFDNSYQYDKMLVEANISFNSTCEHHFLPIVGKAHNPVS